MSFTCARLAAMDFLSSFYLSIYRQSHQTSRLVAVALQKLHFQAVQTVCHESAASRATHPLDVLPTIEIHSPDGLCSSRGEVGTGGTAQFRPVLEQRLDCLSLGFDLGVFGEDVGVVGGYFFQNVSVHGSARLGIERARDDLPAPMAVKTPPGWRA